MPVAKNGSSDAGEHPAMPLNGRVLSKMAPDLRVLFWVPVEDMRWYLNIKAGNRYNVSPLAF
jgi:hypothetical protein